MRSFLACVVVALLSSSAPVGAAEDDGLSRLLTAAASRFPGKLTLYVRHLPSGKEASVAPDEPMNSMSVIKLGILAKAYEMAEMKALDLDARVILKASDFRGGSGIFQYHAAGLNPTVRDLLTQMVITSDNTATDALLARVGGVAALNGWLAQRGFEMKMHSTINTYFAHIGAIVTPLAKGLPEDEVNAALVGQRSGELTPAGRAVAQEFGKIEPWLGICAKFKDASHWLGRASARSVASLLEHMETAKLVPRPRSEEMMDMLKSQQSGARRIPMFIDTQYLIAHKTGDFPPCIANDVGVVYLKSGPTVMVFLSDQIQGNYGEAEAKIGEMARAVADYFDGKQ